LAYSSKETDSFGAKDTGRALHVRVEDEDYNEIIISRYINALESNCVVTDLSTND
jgi:hypothetical protein